MQTSTKQGPGYVDNGRCDVGLEFKPGVCLGRHYHAKRLEAQNRRNSFEPCGYCPLIIDHIKKSQQEQKTMETKEREFCTRCGTAAYLENGLCVNCREDDKQAPKTAKAPAKGKPGQKAACIECKLIKKIATSGICWGCYRKPEIKKKYGIQGNGRPKKNTKPAKTMQNEIYKCEFCGLLCDGRHASEFNGKKCCSDCWKEQLTAETSKPKPSTPIDLPGVGTCPLPRGSEADKALSEMLDKLKPFCEFCREPSEGVKIDGKDACRECFKKELEKSPIKVFIREKKIDLAELKRQAREQENLLKLKYFEISTVERFVQDLEQAIKGA